MNTDKLYGILVESCAGNESLLCGVKQVNQNTAGFHFVLIDSIMPPSMVNSDTTSGNLSFLEEIRTTGHASENFAVNADNTFEDIIRKQITKGYGGEVKVEVKQTNPPELVAYLFNELPLQDNVRNAFAKFVKELMKKK